MTISTITDVVDAQWVQALSAVLVNEPIDRIQAAAAFSLGHAGQHSVQHSKWTSSGRSQATMEAASSSSTLEKREASKRAWQRKGVATDTEYQVIALNTDTPYVFQVAAKNEVGVGPFVELSKAVASSVSCLSKDTGHSQRFLRFSFEELIQHHPAIAFQIILSSFH